MRFNISSVTHHRQKFFGQKLHNLECVFFIPIDSSYYYLHKSIEVQL